MRDFMDPLAWQTFHLYKATATTKELSSACTKLISRAYTQLDSTSTVPDQLFTLL